MFEKKNIKKILFLFFLIHFLYFIFQWISCYLTGNSFDFVYKIMDSENYIHIAEYGYNEEKYYAFFPLIPLIIRFFSVYGTLFINAVLTIFSALLLCYMYGLETSIVFLLSPIQIYCYIPYTESIFIFLTIFVFYLYKKQKWFLMGICLGLGVCDRSMMSMMFFALFVGMCIKYYHKKITFFDICKCYIPATLISLCYPIYLWIKTGNPFLFVEVQYIYWDAIKGNIFSIIYKDIQSFFVQDTYGKYLILLTYITLVLLIIGLCKTKEWELILYSILTILICFSTGKQLYMEASFPPSTSYFRYFLSCFPMYLLPKKKYIYILFIILHILIACNFILSGWPF